MKTTETAEETRQRILRKLRNANRYEPIKPDQERRESLRRSLAAASRAGEKEKRTVHSG